MEITNEEKELLQDVFNAYDPSFVYKMHPDMIEALERAGLVEITEHEYRNPFTGDVSDVSAPVLTDAGFEAAFGYSRAA